jgi:hypothetical protein
MTHVDWHTAIELAGFAPSIHNTQPWRFVVRDEAVELWADRSRAVPAIDPSGRQLVVSCGAALEQLCLGVAAQGWQPVVHVMPSAAASDLLAIVEVGERTLLSPSESLLVDAIGRRATVRAAFDPRPVSAEDLAALRAAVDRSDAWVQPITDHDSLIAFTVLLSHADAAQAADSKYVEELDTWRHRDTNEDGIPDAAVSRLAGRHSSLPLRDFHAPGDDAAAIPRKATPIDEKPLVMVVGTPNDTPADWLAAGRATIRLLLQATSMGIVASPLNQVVDDPAFRRLLRRDLSFVGLPQMVLRLGYGTAIQHTGRRPVEDILVVTN